MKLTAECLCGSSESIILRTGVRYDPALQIRECKKCGLIYLWPRPGEEELLSYYQSEYRKEYDNDSPHDIRFRSDTEEARIRVSRLTGLLSGEKSLLELGSGSGAFLNAASIYAKNVTGVEPDRKTREWIISRCGFRVVGELSELKQKVEKFDLVVLFHALEHMVNPIEFCKSLKGVIKPTGHLIIEVPNIDDALVSLYKIKSYIDFYYQKAHLFYFSSATLKWVLDQAGYNSDIVGVQRYDLSNHIRWMLDGKPGGKGYYHNIFLQSTNQSYADSLIRSGYADTLWAIARLK